jgi:hypothetical protein
MKPHAVLIAALLLVVIVVAIIVGWASVGDRPGPMDSAASYRLENTYALVIFGSWGRTVDEGPNAPLDGFSPVASCPGGMWDGTR